MRKKRRSPLQGTYLQLRCCSLVLPRTHAEPGPASTPSQLTDAPPWHSILWAFNTIASWGHDHQPSSTHGEHTDSQPENPSHGIRTHRTLQVSRTVSTVQMRGRTSRTRIQPGSGPTVLQPPHLPLSESIRDIHFLERPHCILNLTLCYCLLGFVFASAVSPIRTDLAILTKPDCIHSSQH